MSELMTPMTDHWGAHNDDAKWYYFPMYISGHWEFEDVEEDEIVSDFEERLAWHRIDDIVHIDEGSNCLEGTFVYFRVNQLALSTELHKIITEINDECIPAEHMDFDLGE